MSHSQPKLVIVKKILFYNSRVLVLRITPVFNCYALKWFYDI